jgi:Flp pilus assembly protein protease CpaA
MFIPDIMLLITAVSALITASITDLKIKEVPDWLNYGLIISALTIRLMASIIFKNYIYLIYGIFGFCTMFIIGTVFYYTKQWGGGDTKLLMGLGIVFASKPYFTPEARFPFLIILLFNILIIGAIYGLFWTFVLIIKNWDRFKIRFKVRIKNKKVKLAEKIIALIIALSTIFLFIIKDNFLRLAIIIAIGLTIVYLYLWIAIKSIESLSMYKTISVEKLREGDWVAKNVYKDKQLIYQRNSGISKEDIKKIIGSKIKKIVIKEGIPFVPPFLIGTLLSIITGKILFLI